MLVVDEDEEEDEEVGSIRVELIKSTAEKKSCSEITVRTKQASTTSWCLLWL